MNSDISHCYGYGCSAKEKCKRYAPTMKYMYQDYFTVTPGEDETCAFFIKLK